MAHSALHFSIGMVVGSAATLPAVARAWSARERVAGPIRKWLVVSYAMGLYAVAPSLLRWLGVPASITGGWWMNLFLLHPLLTKLKAGGMIPAGFALVLCFIVPYALILAGIWRARAVKISKGDLRP